MTAKGLFITLEGGEGVGKTTQIARLATALEQRGHTVVRAREPGGTPESEALRTLFIDRNGPDWPPEAQALLMYTARALLVEHLIRPALEDGKTVICDRFADSTMAYQGYALGLDLQRIAAIHKGAIEDFAPDITLILDIDPATGLSRTRSRTGADDSFEEKDLAFHTRLREGYRAIAARNTDRCVLIDADRPEEEVASRILQVILEKTA